MLMERPKKVLRSSAITVLLLAGALLSSMLIQEILAADAAAVRQRSWSFSTEETRTPPPSVETTPPASETPSPVQSFMMMAERFSPRLG